MQRPILLTGALVMALGVSLGAISSHAAKTAIHPEAARLLQTAVLYQLIHGLGILAAGILARIAPSRLLVVAASLHLAGIVGFCGSLYVLAFAGSSLGIAAPAGGLAFIAGWLFLAAYALHRK